MASLLQPRQPFAVLDDTRLQALGSIKNRQNNVFSHTSPGKAPSSAPTLKRRLHSEDLNDVYDSENVDPNILNTPSKRSKNTDGTPIKVSKFVLTAEPVKTMATPTNLNPASKRKTLSLSVPPPTTTSSISHSRGSPKHKRISLLSNKRRSSTPYRRIDSLKLSNGSALPFSIDAALSGTISSYTSPTPEVVNNPISAPEPLRRSSTKAMPKSWFFEIHEDTADQEASNLLLHSACVLDISSDDDSSTAAAKIAMERGKENIPPPEWTGVTRTARQAPAVPHKGIHSHKKAMKYTAMGGPDAMLEDRVALREMDTAAFFPDGLDEKSVEVVEEKSSPLAQEVEVAASEIRDAVPATEVMVKEDDLVV